MSLRFCLSCQRASPGDVCGSCGRRLTWRRCASDPDHVAPPDARFCPNLRLRRTEGVWAIAQHRASRPGPWVAFDARHPDAADARSRRILVTSRWGTGRRGLIHILNLPPPCWWVCLLLQAALWVAIVLLTSAALPPVLGRPIRGATWWAIRTAGLLILKVGGAGVRVAWRLVEGPPSEPDKRGKKKKKAK